MADVTLTYKGNTIAELSASGNKTIETAGKYCEADIGLTYVQPSGNNGWVKPADWPDLSSVTLPNDDTTSVVYLLYEKGLSIDDVDIRIRDGGDVYKGTISGGAFVGEKVANGVTQYTDTLTNEYTVYKIEGTYTGLTFAYGISVSYCFSEQNVVWIYGSAPTITGLGGPTSTTCAFSRFTQAYCLKRTKVLTWLTFSNNIYPPLTLQLFYVGYNSNGDFNNNSLERTGDGPMFFAPSNPDDIVTIQNVSNLKIAIGAFKNVPHIDFKNCTGTFAAQRWLDCFYVRSIKFSTSGLSCTDMYYQFSACRELESCDLSMVDFSSMTRSTNAFQKCNNLKNLKLNNTWSADLNLGDCYNLSRESIIGIFNALPTIQTTKTITLTYGVKNYLLTADDIAIVTAKGWTVA